MTGAREPTPPGTVLGIDIGGSTSRAWLDAGGATVARATAPSASLVAAGREQAAAVIAALLAELGLAPSTEAAPDRTTLDAVCVGTAGSGAGEAVGWVVDRFLGTVKDGDPERVVVVNDSRLALAAERLDSGIALIAGTGSTAVGVLGDQEERAGGWGYRLGDDGSGYWVVREGVRELCRRHDEGRPPGQLGEALLDRLGAADALEVIQLFHEQPSPARWASLAPAVLDSGDPAAETILTAAANALASLVESVALRLPHPSPLPVVVSGGLVVNHAPLGEATSAAITVRLASRDPVVRLATNPPVAGAVHLARALAARLQRHGAAGAGTMG